MRGQRADQIAALLAAKVVAVEGPLPPQGAAMVVEATLQLISRPRKDAAKSLVSQAGPSIWKVEEPVENMHSAFPTTTTKITLIA
jgi:hypothetical protein